MKYFNPSIGAKAFEAQEKHLKNVLDSILLQSRSAHLIKIYYSKEDTTYLRRIITK